MPPQQQPASALDAPDDRARAEGPRVLARLRSHPAARRFQRAFRPPAGPQHESAPGALTPPVPRAASIVSVALGFGLIAGWAEMLVVLAQRAWVAQISMDSLRTNRFFTWMIPTCDVLIFGAVGLVIALLSPPALRVGLGLAWRLFAALAALACLSAIEGLHPIASVVLACGIGSKLGPAMERQAARRGSSIRAVCILLAGALVAVAGIETARLSSAEMRSLAKLPPAAPGTPNVIVMVLDNVRAASMGLYGYDRPTTPNIDRLARRGLWFTEARSAASWTLPSHASMFTGRWPHELSVGYDRALDGTYPTLAEYLADHGYATAGFVGNIYYCNARYGLNRGFAHYDDYYENRSITPSEIFRSATLGKGILRLLNVPVRAEDARTSVRKTAAMLNRDCLGWLEQQPKDRPFFVFLNYFDAHCPFIPPAGPDPRFGNGALSQHDRDTILNRYQRLITGKYRAEDGDKARIEREATDTFRDCYESCIAYLDRQVGLLFDELERRGTLKNTLVILTSDHGEHFNEHGFLGHSLSLYRREVHVPLLIFPPSDAPAGLCLREPVSLRDLPATAVDLLRLRSDSPFPGKSMARLWNTLERSTLASDPPICELEYQARFKGLLHLHAARGPVRSVLVQGKEYIRDNLGGEELYDLPSDPLETRNLAREPGVTASMENCRKALQSLLDGPAGLANERADVLQGTRESHGAAQRR